MIQGPDSVRQVIELNEDYGYDRPFSGVIETPGDTLTLTLTLTPTLILTLTPTLILTPTPTPTLTPTLTLTRLRLRGAHPQHRADGLPLQRLRRAALAQPG